MVAAILGTREGAAEGGYRLRSTGVTWTDTVDAAALRDALAAHKVENIMLVSAFLAAAALTQSVGNATGYARTGLLFVPTSARSSSYRHSRCRLRQHPPCRRRRFRPPLHRLPLLRLRRRRPPFRRFKCLRFRNCRCLHRPRLRRRLLPHRNYRRRDPAHACLGQGYRVLASPCRVPPSRIFRCRTSRASRVCRQTAAAVRAPVLQALAPARQPAAGPAVVRVPARQVYIRA